MPINKNYDVLIVEDNFEQASLIKMLMEQNGFKADYVIDSTQAFSQILKKQPSVVILDLMMPNLDGLRLCKQIKETPKTSHTKIIIYSGKMYESDRRKALKLGADAFFIKPTRAYHLVNKIKELMQTKPNAAYQD